VGHETKDVFGAVGDAGNLFDRTIESGGIALSVTVAQQNLPMFLQLSQALGVDVVVAIGVCDGDIEDFARGEAVKKSVVGVDDDKVLDFGDEVEVGVALESTGEQAGLGKDLKTVANTDNQFSGGDEPLQLITQSEFHAICEHGSRPQVVAKREPADEGENMKIIQLKTILKCITVNKNTEATEVNYMISNKPCGIDDNLGYNLFIGNNPYKNIPPSFDVELFQIVNYISNGKRIDNKRLKNFAINYIKKYPIIFILKFPYKISRLLGSGITEIADYWKKRRFLNNSTIILFIINWGIPALLSLIFLFFLPYCFSCNKNFRFILYTLISFALVHGIFFGMPRYREPLIPLMLIVTIAGGVRFGKIGKFTPISLLLSTSLIYYYILELYSFTR